MKVDFPTSINIINNEFFDKEKIHDYTDIITGELFIICGPGFSFDIAKKLIIKANLNPKEIVIVHNNSVEELNKLEPQLSSKECTILGVGGGKVCDFSKRLAYVTENNLILFPTVVSNDGLISPIAVLSRDGKTYSLPGKMPEHVFIDLEVIKKAPKKYIIAAALDLLSNISATSDWEYAEEHGQTNMHYLAYQFSRIAAFQLLDCVSWEVDSPEFLRAVIHGQILSAMAMAYAGSSRPCSGSEHLISHALDELGISTNLLHGEKVGRATLFSLYLQNKSNKKIISLFKHFMIKECLTDENLADDKLVEVFSCARKTRPGRKTIIDDFTDDELLLKYREFERTMRW
ncbi:TPA: iron-containing alcohol dehydrogenase [Vibrio harveyi]|nr:iron-containing alcohol dehydrogenase [Vibrio harveyi]